MMARSLKMGGCRLVLGLLVVGALCCGCRSSKAVFSDVPGLALVSDPISIDATHVVQVGDLMTVHYMETNNEPRLHEERVRGDGTINLPGVGFNRRRRKDSRGTE